MTDPSGHTRIALVGASGFGATHLTNILALSSRVRLIGIADPAHPSIDPRHGLVPRYESLDELLAGSGVPDITIVSTPIHTHEELATTALEAGSDVYLEKPAVPSRAAFDRLRATEERTGRAVQVGFQSLGSTAIGVLASGAVGRILALSATGLWMRERSYWERSAWAGRRRLGDVDVVDGVLTNPLAHAIATALRIAGAWDASDLENIDVDLYRANENEADDTSVVSAVTTGGVPITAALTLCAEASEEPYVTVTGSEGSARFWYTKDRVEFDDGRVDVFDRIDLLENLIDHRTAAKKLISPLASAAAFTEIVEAVRTAPDPKPIDAKYLRWVGIGENAHPVVEDVAYWIERATTEQRTFASLGAPWAQLAAVTA